LSRIGIRAGRFPWINIVLFVLTCLSTSLVGTLLMSDFNNTLSGDLFEEIGKIFQNPFMMLAGLPFSVSIMTILFAHEMGHYLTCLYYGIDASLPYFIPAPTPVGTMGAFIKIRAPIQDRAALLDVGIAGPIAGFVLAVPALFIGLMYSRFEAVSEYAIGQPLAFKFAAILMGKLPPTGMVLVPHPIVLASCFGFLATTLNLLPAAQLDGGHVTYALFPNLHKRISQAIAVVLLPLGIWYWQGWLVWVVLLVFVLRFRHPTTLDDSVPLERRHFWLGWIGLAMFVLCFTPTPIYIP